MIHPVLKIITAQLNAYIDQVKKSSDEVTSPVAVLQSINNIEENKLKTTNNLLVSVVNITEEAALKNLPGYEIRENDRVFYRNPPVNLNVFVLITAVMSNYENELRYLDHVIRFFQGQPVFTRQGILTPVEGIPDDLKVNFDLYSLSFEQVNYLWSTMGSKQHPFVVYKLRILEMERESTSEVRGVIRQIRIDEAPGQ
jgi:hypothetical protein